ncbi:acetyl-CoA C-acyltransferase [Burkholderia sp. 22PA0099]|uniref:thiolase family protein n=1 Tax=Burkholderia sp. 22PA0099 TaxID=3237372 RepID=UPI0039C3EE21
MKIAREVVLAAPVRTAIGTFNGSLKEVPATDLGAHAIQASLSRSRIEPARVASVVMGNVVQAGNRMNPARQAAMGAGVSHEVPALTVNRVCGSGAQAIVSAAQEVLLGLADAAIAGGMENMDRAPYLLPGARHGYRMGDAQVLDSVLLDGLLDAFSGEHSGWHTEDLVAREGISRDAQDRWAERSQQRFAAAQRAGHFVAEIEPIEVRLGKRTTRFDQDEHNRPDTTLDKLATLRPAFREGGTLTAGNAPGLNSGAAAMLVVERGLADRQGIEPFARLVSWGVAGVEPGLFGLGPVPAIRQALDRAGWRLGDIDALEINEAFAAVPLAVMGALGLPADIVNIEGGAVAHGHPIGATGAILATRLMHAMRRNNQRRGVVSLCIGGGQGIALALERI